jgi:hypothetical protein
MLVRRGATRMFSDGFTDIVWEPRSGEEPVSTGITHEDGGMKFCLRRPIRFRTDEVGPDVRT